MGEGGRHERRETGSSVRVMQRHSQPFCDLIPSIASTMYQLLLICDLITDVASMEGSIL